MKGRIPSRAGRIILDLPRSGPEPGPRIAGRCGKGLPARPSRGLWPNKGLTRPRSTPLPHACRIFALRLAAPRHISLPFSIGAFEPHKPFGGMHEPFSSSTRPHHTRFQPRGRPNWMRSGHPSPAQRDDEERGPPPCAGRGCAARHLCQDRGGSRSPRMPESRSSSGPGVGYTLWMCPRQPSAQGLWSPMCRITAVSTSASTPWRCFSLGWRRSWLIGKSARKAGTPAPGNPSTDWREHARASRKNGRIGQAACGREGFGLKSSAATRNVPAEPAFAAGRPWKSGRSGEVASAPSDIVNDSLAPKTPRPAHHLRTDAAHDEAVGADREHGRGRPIIRTMTSVRAIREALESPVRAGRDGTGAVTARSPIPDAAPRAPDHRTPGTPRGTPNPPELRAAPQRTIVQALRRERRRHSSIR